MGEKKKTVKKDNSIVQKSRYRMSTIQQKIVSYVIANMQMCDKPSDTVTFRVGDFLKDFEMDRSNAMYAYIKENTKAVRDKSVWIDIGEGKSETCSWFTKITWESNGNIITVKIDEAMMKYIRNLRERFGMYELSNVARIKSQYSYRLYEYLNSFANLGKPLVVDMKKLKEVMDAVDAYDGSTAEFKRKILDLAVNEINNKTNLRCSYENIKHGREIIAIKFKVKKIKKETKDKDI